MSSMTTKTASPATADQPTESHLVYLTRRCEFSASHFYHNPEFSPEENRRIFGKCNNPNGHGHNYVLELTVKGAVDPRSGFVVDLRELKQVLEHEVMEVFDHRHLNLEVPEFRDRIPTTENVAIAIWNRLAAKLKAATIHRVRVYESPDLFVDFYGEDS
jgi:6-pyruvoyltetrahydropterin/6-carboxytetrahydropterin synthase